MVAIRWFGVVGCCAIGAWGAAYGADDMGTMSAEDHAKMMQEHGGMAQEHGAMTAEGAHVGHHASGKGSWMVQYRYMHMAMEGLMNGHHEATAEDVYALGYAMAPKHMTMDMHMLMAMYGFTNKWSAMVEFNYVKNEMLMSMSGMEDMHMDAQGLGDTVVSGIFQFDPHWQFNVGVVLPTGATDEEGHGMGGHLHQPYYMQPGSGTVGLKPGAAVQFDVGAFNVGARGSAIYRMGYNAENYNLGHRADGDAWVKYHGVPHLELSAGLSGHYLGKVDAKSTSHLLDNIAEMPDYDPNNTGSFRMEAVFGVGGVYKNFTAELEYGLPVFERMRGIQLETHAVFGFAVHAMF